MKTFAATKMHKTYLSFMTRVFVVYLLGALAAFPAQAQTPDKRAETEQLRTQVLKLYGEGKYDEALPLANRALELSESSFGPTDIAVADAATNLAVLYVAKGKLDKAEPLLLRAIEINDKLRRPVDTVVVRTLELYSCVLHGKGQDDKLKAFDKSRLPMLMASPEPDRFWGAIWHATEVVHLPKPDYPRSNVGMAAQGRVIMEVIVNEEGKVIHVRNMCGGNVMLVKAAEDSVIKAQYKPIIAAGKPVRVIGYQLYRFVVQ
jgi:tetratricopeptide (TPR) repeat protein